MFLFIGEYFIVRIIFTLDQIIDLTTQNLIFHSYYGVSRSAAVVLAFLMKKHSLDFDEALQR